MSQEAGRARHPQLLMQDSTRHGVWRNGWEEEDGAAAAQGGGAQGEMDGASPGSGVSREEVELPKDPQVRHRKRVPRSWSTPTLRSLSSHQKVHLPSWAGPGPGLLG